VIEQKVIVTQVTDDYLVLDPVPAGCSSCDQGSCGVANISSLFGKRSRAMRIANPGGFGLNEEAELLMNESFFIKTVLIQYFLPLIATLLAILIAGLVTPMFVIQLAFTIAGLTFGVLVSRYLIRRMETRLSSRAIRIRKCMDVNDNSETGIHIITP